MKHYYSKLPNDVEDLIIDYLYSREVDLSKRKMFRELHLSYFLKRISKMYRNIRVYHLLAHV